MLHFWCEAFTLRRINIVKFRLWNPPGCHSWAKYARKRGKKPKTKIFLYLYTCERKRWRHGYDVHEAFYWNCEIHVYLVWVFSSRVGPILKNLYFTVHLLGGVWYISPFYYNISVEEDKYIIMMTWKFPSKIVNVMFPCVLVLTLRQGQIGSVVFKHMYTIIFWNFLSMRHICKRYWFHNFLKQESIFLNFKSHVF